MSALRDAALAAERVWLSPTAEPLPRRAARAGWAPDAFDAYCDRCGADIGPFESVEFGCAACHDRRFRWVRFVRLGAYDPPLRDWVLELKFQRFRALGVALGELLGSRLLDAGLDPTRALVAPAPMTRRRRAARGVDHAAALAAGVAGRLRCPVVRPLARGHAPSQRSVAFSRREANVRGRFRPSLGWGRGGSWLVRDARAVVLVDDVRTSGATLRAGARALERVAWGGSRPELWVAVAAVARDPSRRAVVGAAEGVHPRFVHIDSSPA